MPKSYSAWDMSRIPILGLVPEKSASAPGSPVAGQQWVDTSVTPNKLKWYDGTQWVAADYSSIPAAYITDSMISGAAGIQLSKLATNPLARANHTGTQLAATVSDFDTQVRTSRLDQLTAPTAAVSLNNQRLTSVADPTSASDAANRKYVDDARAGIASVKSPARIALTTLNVNSPASTLDGVAMVAGDRVLYAPGSPSTTAGILVFNGAGALMTRPPDSDATGEIVDGTLVAVAEGTYAGYQFIQTATPPTDYATFAQQWVAFQTGGQTYTAGTGLTLVGSQFRLVNPVTVALGGTGASTAAGARTALGAIASYTGLVPALTAGSAGYVAHNLNSSSVQAQFFSGTTARQVYLDWDAYSATQIRVIADIDVANGALLCTVQG